ncbi:hypothetical protein HCEG_00975 [Histoplasma capsulatum var. duboisii H88]|uniref:Uncharacterized protein n=2 Tax=Ajellomyces capsulatus TaxID=5037 RepID=F0U7P4_AJEC8|nr:hypothetical protein HCDG_01245 [Histoplasma capsulatum H143]EGC41613.1 hypothetical protein HCEG_00975 [Histoplasma capsulatum var. duboisii H88]
MSISRMGIVTADLVSAGENGSNVHLGTEKNDYGCGGISAIVLQNFAEFGSARV